MLAKNAQNVGIYSAQENNFRSLFRVLEIYNFVRRKENSNPKKRKLYLSRLKRERDWQPCWLKMHKMQAFILRRKNDFRRYPRLSLLEVSYTECVVVDFTPVSLLSNFSRKKNIMENSAGSSNANNASGRKCMKHSAVVLGICDILFYFCDLTCVKITSLIKWST